MDLRQLARVQSSWAALIDRPAHPTGSPHQLCLRRQAAKDRLQVLPDIIQHVVLEVHARVVVLHNLVALGIANET